MNKLKIQVAFIHFWVDAPHVTDKGRWQKKIVDVEIENADGFRQWQDDDLIVRLINEALGKIVYGGIKLLTWRRLDDGILHEC